MNNAPPLRLWPVRAIEGRPTAARPVLLTLAGWTSLKIAEAFGVREDTVRLWRSNSAPSLNSPSREQVVPHLVLGWVNFQRKTK